MSCCRSVELSLVDVVTVGVVELSVLSVLPVLSSCRIVVSVVVAVVVPLCVGLCVDSVVAESNSSGFDN